MKSRKRPTARAGVTPERIVDEATRLVDADGVRALSLGRIADELGVRTPSLYAHVDGLDHVERLLKLRALRGLLDEVRRSTVGKAGRDALVALADAQRRFSREHPGLFAATATIARDDGAEVQAVSKELVNTVVAVLAGYGLTGDDALHATRVLRAATRGFIDLEREGGFGLPLEVDESWRRLVDMLDAGLRSSSAGVRAGR